MAKYRKKPIVISAVQFTGTDESLREITELAGSQPIKNDGHSMVIPTLEGWMIASLGDFIIRGVAGEVYPCKESIFKNTYESVDN